MWPHNDSSMTEYTFDGGTTSWNRQHPHSKRKESGEVVLIHQPEVQAGIRTFLIVVKFGSHLQVSVVLGCRPVARIFFGGVRSLERKGYFCQRFSVAVKSIYNQLRHDNSLLL